MKSSKKEEYNVHKISAYILDRKLWVFTKKNINQTDQFGNTALHYAALNGLVDVIKELIKKEPDLNAVNNDGETPMYMAAKEANWNVVKFLAEQGAKIKYRVLKKVEEAKKQKKLELYGIYKDAPTDLKSLFDKLKKAHKPLQSLKELIKIGDLQKITFYNNNGFIKINEKYEDSKTPLHHAVIANKPKLVEYFVNNEAKVNEKDKHGNTPLHYAVLYGYGEIVTKLLAQKNITANTKNVEGYTLLHAAISSKDPNTISLILKRTDVDLNAQTNISRRTALHMAVTKKLENVVIGLLKKPGIDVEIKDAGKKTALDLATGNIKIHINDYKKAKLEGKKYIPRKIETIEKI